MQISISLSKVRFLHPIILYIKPIMHTNYVNFCKLTHFSNNRHFPEHYRMPGLFITDYWLNLKLGIQGVHCIYNVARPKLRLSYESEFNPVQSINSLCSWVLIKIEQDRVRLNLSTKLNCGGGVCYSCVLSNYTQCTSMLKQQYWINNWYEI